MTFSLKIAFVHDWLVNKGGAEKVLTAMLELWPEASVYTLFYDPNGPCQPFLEGHQVHTSFLQNLPLALRYYRSYLPLMPLAVEQFDLSDYDIVISNSHAVAKGVLTSPDTLHISYCCSPIRYAWDLQFQYLQESNLAKGLKSWIARWVLHQVRKWDYRTANGVDEFIAISNFIARRIWKIYRRESLVIYPPVDTEYFSLHKQKEDFYLTVSRMVPYKRIRLIVEAFSEMPEKKLIIVGNGPEFKKIKALTTSNIQLLGYQSLDALRSYMKRARAFIFAAEEDFGIAPVEAQACGTPVIAYGKGGALETVINGRTGVIFKEQSVLSLKIAIEKFENLALQWDPQIIRENVEYFSKERFHREFQKFVEKTWQKFQEQGHSFQ